MQLSDVRFRRNAAELTQFYYRLLRFTLNASTASGLSDGTLAFIPQLCDLGKECRDAAGQHPADHGHQRHRA